MTQPLGFGFIGAGAIANFHARAVAAARGARAIGVVSRRRSTAEAFAKEHGLGYASENVQELLRQPGLDAVCITTPSALHLEPALAAIRAGKHLMIEKPLDSTVEGTDHILHEAEKAGVRVGSVFQARFGDAARQVKAAVEAGRFGRMVLASCYVKWNRTAEYYSGWKGKLAEDGGGVIINQAIHGVDLLQWFAGMPVEVFAWATQRVHRIESEDTCVAALKFGSGAFGTIEGTTATWPGWSRRIELCGEHGSVCLEDDHIARWDFARAEPEDEAIRTAPRDNSLGSGAGAAGSISLAGHLRQIQDFVAAVREDRAPIVDGREGRKAVALIHAIYESARTGVAVRL